MVHARGAACGAFAWSCMRWALVMLSPPQQVRDARRSGACLRRAGTHSPCPATHHDSSSCRKRRASVPSLVHVRPSRSSRVARIQFFGVSPRVPGIRPSARRRAGSRSFRARVHSSSLPTSHHMRPERGVDFGARSSRTTLSPLEDPRPAQRRALRASPAPRSSVGFSRKPRAPVRPASVRHRTLHKPHTPPGVSPENAGPRNHWRPL